MLLASIFLQEFAAEINYLALAFGKLEATTHSILKSNFSKLLRYHQAGL